MAKWICKVCGYIHQGDEAPEICPQCSAPKTQFYRERKATGCIWCIVIFIALIVGSCIVFSSCSTVPKVDNSTVKSLDLNRFMGRWYEIARFDHKFERDLQQVTTIYAIQTNGKVKVINQGIKNDEWKNIEGTAKLTTTPGLLRVSFWGPFYSDYRILMLASDYSYALIGGEDDTYLWILSRSPQLTPVARNLLLSEAQRRGYNTNNFIWVEHPESK